MMQTRLFTRALSSRVVALAHCTTTSTTTTSTTTITTPSSFQSLPTCSSRFFHQSSLLSFSTSDASPASSDEKAVLNFLTAHKLQDFAEKFSSFDVLLHSKTEVLKKHGLNVKQRKTLLKAIENYKMTQRIKRAEVFIYEKAHQLSPTELQKGVYAIIYEHLFERQQYQAQAQQLEAVWRARVDAYKAERRIEHNNFRGLVPDVFMKLAKAEAVKVAELLKELKEEEAKRALTEQTEVAAETEEVAVPIDAQAEVDMVVQSLKEKEAAAAEKKE